MMERIEEKLDRVLETQAGQAVTLAKQAVTLEHLTEAHGILAGKVASVTEMKLMLSGAWRLMAALGAGAATCAGCLKALGKL